MTSPETQKNDSPKAIELPKVESPKVGLKDTSIGLDLPWSEDIAQQADDLAGPHAFRYLSRTLTKSMARDVWLKWNPQRAARVEDDAFLGHFRRFLCDGIDLGYRLNRFREVSGRLPEPGPTAATWIPFFEEVVAGDDCGGIRLFLSREQKQALDASVPQGAGEVMSWEKMLAMMNDGLFYELGLVYRPITVAVDEDLATPWIRCEWNDLRLPGERGIQAGRVLVNDTVDRLVLLNIKGEKAVNPTNGSECAVIDESDQAKARDAGLTTWDWRGYALLLLSSAIRRAAPALINRPLYDLYTLRLRDFRPQVPSSLTGLPEADFMVQVLRGLLAEEISIRDLSTIIEAAATLRATVDVDLSKYIVFAPCTAGVFPDADRRPVSTLTPSDYAEFIRSRLQRYISHKYTRGGNTLVVYLMDRDSEKVLAEPNELNAEVRAAILKAVREEVGSLPATAQRPVILTTLDVRRRLHGLIAAEFPHLAVVSYQELSPDTNVQPIARITADL